MEKLIEKILRKLLGELADQLKGELLGELKAEAAKLVVAELQKHAILKTLLKDAGEASEKAVAAEEKAEEGEQGAEDPVAIDDLSAVEWCWGGFDGSHAEEVPEAKIKNLKVTDSAISYEWESGGCEALGAAGKDDATKTVACLFVTDGAWKGGKFEWVSTSRTSRDAKNILEGYNGWDAAAFKAAQGFRFCIASADGKKRTNFIEATR